MRSSRLENLLPDVIDNPRERRNVEYKRTGLWEDLKYKISRTVLAMANLKDGGIIIVGVEDEPNGLQSVGMADADFESYAADEVLDCLGKYMFSPANVNVEKFILDDGRKFVIVDVDRFAKIPMLAKKDYCPPGERPYIVKHALYYRPATGRPRTEIATAEEYDEIFDYAVDVRAAEQLARQRRIEAMAQSLAPQESAYDKELEGF